MVPRAVATAAEQTTSTDTSTTSELDSLQVNPQEAEISAAHAAEHTGSQSAAMKMLDSSDPVNQSPGTEQKTQGGSQGRGQDPQVVEIEFDKSMLTARELKKYLGLGGKIANIERQKEDRDRQLSRRIADLTRKNVDNPLRLAQRIEVLQFRHARSDERSNRNIGKLHSQRQEMQKSALERYVANLPEGGPEQSRTAALNAVEFQLSMLTKKESRQYNQMQSNLEKLARQQADADRRHDRLVERALLRNRDPIKLARRLDQLDARHDSTSERRAIKADQLRERIIALEESAVVRYVRENPPETGR